MKILIIGSGAREVAISTKLLGDNDNIIIHNMSTYENIDMAAISEKIIIIDDYSIDSLGFNIDLMNDYSYVIIGPEKPLESGYANFFKELNIPCFGPTCELAQLETSKAYCRRFLYKNGLGHLSPEHKVIDNSNYNEVCHVLDHFINCNKQIVVKKNGLHSGKGVIVQGVDFKNPYDILDSLLNNEESKIVIEEKLEGDEFSLFSICDGNEGIKHFPPIMDYKRLNDNNLGENTGGMGCIIDNNNSLPFLTEIDIQYVNTINSIIYELNPTYVGILYGSYMKCYDGNIKIIEMNCRFGDPECIIALELLESNFFDLLEATLTGKLSEYNDIQFSKDAMVCVYMVPKEYPNVSRDDRYDIYFNDYNVLESANLIFSNVIVEKKHLYTSTSRALVLWERGDTIHECRINIYKNIKTIAGNLYYRKDIGEKVSSTDRYSNCGVSVNKAEKALSLMKNDIMSTYNENVLSDYGAFSGEYKLNNNVLLASIDGVGTKSTLVKQFKGSDGFISLGYDIVHHSINDILVQGGKPLFFLDYFGTDHLNMDEIFNFVKGISEACRKYNIVLMGGETAEMPGFYSKGNTELLGCIIGIKETTFDSNLISSGDILVYIDSSGPHTNGYSLLRTLNLTHEDIEEYPELLVYHRCYYDDIKELVSTYGPHFIKGMCHITGGGLFGNLKRVIPKELHDRLHINLESLEYPPWVLFLKERLDMPIEELIDVFNCGIGYVIIVSSDSYNNELKDNMNIKYLGKII